MANYNYVAPIKYKTYSDMNKERLALKAAQDASKLKQQSAAAKQRQKYLDQLSGLSTEDWSDLHRDEFKIKVQEAKNYINSTPINEVDFGVVSDALIRMQDLGNSHAELRKGQDEYGSYIGPNAAKYDADLDWGISATHDKEGYDQRLSTFNNVGLINYSNGIGDFPNPDYNPSAAEGDPNSYQTMRELMASQGARPDPNNRKNVIIEGKSVPVSGSAFDVAQGGFEGLWNPDLSPLNPYRAEVAFSSYSNDEESNIFAEHAKLLNKKVDATEISYDNAKAELKSHVLSYLNPESRLADKALMFSAITDYELPVDQGGTGQKWDDVSQDPNLIAIHGTPWERFADKMVNTADLFDPATGGDPKLSPNERRMRREFGSESAEEPSREFVRELRDPQYDWDQALITAETDEERDIIKNLVEKDPDSIVRIPDGEGGFTEQYKYKLKDKEAFGPGARIYNAPKDIQYKGYYTDVVEVFSDQNIAIVYTSGKVQPGDPAFGLGADSDDVRWMPILGGDTADTPFMVINLYNDDIPPTETQEFKDLKRMYNKIYTNAFIDKYNKALDDD